MEFPLNNEHRMFQAAVQNFCKKEMDPIITEKVFFQVLLGADFGIT